MCNENNLRPLASRCTTFRVYILQQQNTARILPFRQLKLQEYVTLNYGAVFRYTVMFIAT